MGLNNKNIIYIYGQVIEFVYWTPWILYEWILYFKLSFISVLSNDCVSYENIRWNKVKPKLCNQLFQLKVRIFKLTVTHYVNLYCRCRVSIYGVGDIMAAVWAEHWISRHKGRCQTLYNTTRRALKWLY